MHETEQPEPLPASRKGRCGDPRSMEGETDQPKVQCLHLGHERFAQMVSVSDNGTFTGVECFL